MLKIKATNSVAIIIYQKYDPKDKRKQQKEEEKNGKKKEKKGHTELN